MNSLEAQIEIPQPPLSRNALLKQYRKGIIAPIFLYSHVASQNHIAEIALAKNVVIANPANMILCSTLFMLLGRPDAECFCSISSN